MQARILLELISIDRERATSLIKSLEEFIMLDIAGSKSSEISNMVDYISWRIIDVGALYEPFSIRPIFAKIIDLF